MEDKIVTLDDLAKGDPLPRPYVIKPVDEGSSMGVFIVEDGMDLDLSLLQGFSRLMAEAYVPGRELTVAAFQGRAHVVTELNPHEGFYDYEAKYTDGQTDHMIPADLPKIFGIKPLRYANRLHRPGLSGRGAG